MPRLARILGSLRSRLLARVQRTALLAAAREQHLGVPDFSGTVEVETTFARLLLEERDEVITPALLATSGWEPGETALIGGYLQPGMTVIDAGAHVGYYTCLAARLVGPRGLVLAFEPAPRNYELLLANVWRNGFANVACFPWALGAENRFATLAQSPTNTGDNRLLDESGTVERGRDAVTVRVASLDLAGLVRGPVHLVKADVQGREEQVLRGMERLLAASPDVLVSVEFWPAGIAASGRDPTQVLAYFRGLGFAIRAQLPDEKGVLDLSEQEILDWCRGRDAGEGHINLVLQRGG